MGRPSGLISRIIVWVAIISITIGFALTLQLKVDISDAIGSDFISYYNGATLLAQGKGKELYEIVTQFENQQRITQKYLDADMLLPFRNLPFVALLFYPLAFFPLLEAYKIFQIIFTLGVICLLWLAFKNFPKLRINPIIILVLLLFYPLFASLKMAQISVFVTFVLLLVYMNIKRRKFFLGGVLTGLLILKLQYVVFIPFLFTLLQRKKEFISRKRKPPSLTWWMKAIKIDARRAQNETNTTDLSLWMFIKGLLLTLTVLLLVSVFVSGPGFFMSYYRFLQQTEGPAFGSRPWQMFTFYSSLVSFGLTQANAAILNTVAYLVFLFTFYIKRKKISFEVGFSSAVIISTYFSIHVLVHDLLVMFVPILILINNSMVKKLGGYSLILVVILLYLLPLTKFIGGLQYFSFTLPILALFLLT